VRIFAVTPNYPPHSRVGAWLATHQLLAHLAGRGHQVTVLTLYGPPSGYSLDGVQVVPFDRGRTLDDGVRTSDLVVSHCGDNGAATAAAAKHHIPNLRMAHGHITRPASLAGAALVVFNSHALADSVDCPSPWIVVHPVVHPETWATQPGDRVTLVNLSEPKGGELFWRLARALPDRQFLGVRGGYGAQYLASRPNVDLVATTDNMRDDVYRRTRILLMPSSAETWGMTAVEAIASGIPVIAHPTPGLVESLGPAGIYVDRADGAGWVAEIERLHDRTEWADASTSVLARSGELNPAGDLARFTRIVEHLGARTCAP